MLSNENVFPYILKTATQCFKTNIQFLMIRANILHLYDFLTSKSTTKYMI